MLNKVDEKTGKSSDQESQEKITRTISLGEISQNSIPFSLQANYAD
jgi:hypothetical protein